MPSLARDEIEKSLTKKGFREDPGGDHRFFRLVVDEKYTGIYTKTSRGSGYKTLSSDLVTKMGQQRKMRRD